MSKHGEWNAAEDHSGYVDKTWFIQTRTQQKVFGELSLEEQWEDLIKRSRKEVEDGRGWGVVAVFEGRVYAKGKPAY